MEWLYENRAAIFFVFAMRAVIAEYNEALTFLNLFGFIFVSNDV